MKLTEQEATEFSQAFRKYISQRDKAIDLMDCLTHNKQIRSKAEIDYWRNEKEFYDTFECFTGHKPSFIDPYEPSN